MSNTPFSIDSLLSEDVYPYSYTFPNAPFRGLTLHFRPAPADSLSIIEAAIGDKLAALGFNPKVAVLHLIGEVKLTGAEFLEFEDAFDKLTAEKRVELAANLREGIHALVVRIVGSWNSPDSLDLLPALLQKYPQVTRAIFEAANGVTRPADKGENR